MNGDSTTINVTIVSKDPLQSFSPDKASLGSCESR